MKIAIVTDLEGVSRVIKKTHFHPTDLVELYSAPVEISYEK